MYYTTELIKNIHAGPNYNVFNDTLFNFQTD